MWYLDNRTPFAAERTWVRDINGHHHWIVAVKATYTANTRGDLVLADDQIPPLHEPEYFGEPGVSSIRYEADLIAAKPGTDVTLNANAHTPGGKPAREVAVALRINGRAKILTVFGERSYDGIVQLATSSPAEFTSCPIRYELAFGGSDTADPDPKRQRLDPRNPIGRGDASSLAALRGKPAHRIEYPGGSPARSGPAGFGALASYWSPRLELAGTYGRHWEQTKRPLLPDDYDPRCLSCSPQDQRPPGQWLIGGERIELVNMTPNGAMSFEVPGHVCTFRSLFGRRSREHVGQIASVVVDAEDSRVIVVWQSSLAVEPDEIDYLDKTIIEVT